MPFGSTQTSSQTSTSAPWGPSGDALKYILREAKGLYNQGSGFEPYPHKGWVPFSDQSNQALQSMSGMASQPNPFYGGERDFTQSLIGGGQNLDQGGFRGLLGQGPNAISQYGTGIASGANGINVNPQLQGLMGQNANAIGRYGTGVASGANGIGTESDYRNLLNSVDPEFEKTVGQTANDLGDQIQRNFGGASYGSGGNTDYLTKGVGDVVSRMRSDNFARNMGIKSGLLGGITGVQGQNIANQLGAAGMLSGEQSGNRAQQAGLLGQMGGFQGQNISNRLGAAGMLSGEQQTGFGNQRGLYGDIANLQQGDIANRMGGLGMADSVYNSQYLPAQHMLDVGGAYEGKAGEKLQSKMDKFNTRNMSDWDRLMQYFGVASGSGAQGNRTQTSVSQPTNPWGQILGGLLMGSQIL